MPTAGRTLSASYASSPVASEKPGRQVDFTHLLTDVTSRVFDVYPDSTVIYPGHGDDTTLGNERPHLGEWRERGW